MGAKFSIQKVTIEKLKREYEAMQVRVQRLTDLLVDGAVSKEIYESKLKEFKDRIHEIKAQIESHPYDNPGSWVAASEVFALAKRHCRYSKVLKSNKRKS